MADIAGNTSTTSIIPGSGTFMGALELSNDSDWWRMSLTGGLSYAFKITGDGSASTLGEGELVLRDSLGNRLNSTREGNILTVSPTTSGTFYLDVRDGYTFDNQAEGNYVITTWMGDTVKNNTSTNRAITTSGSTAGDLNQNRDSDWYRVNLVEGRTYGFTMVGDGSTNSLGSGELTLRDAAGNAVRTVADGTQLSFRASATGVYYIDAHDGYVYDNLGEGNYVIKSVLTDTVVSNASTTALVKAGYETRGRVDVAQDSDWYRLDTQNGVTYELRLSGTGATPLWGNRVFLLDSNGTRIKYDYGSSTDNALLTFKATSAGPYYVVVRSDSDYDTDIGDFVLTVRSDARWVIGTAGNDVLAGMDNDNAILAAGGNDVLRGNGGDDRLIGGGGNDTLLGGAGHDVADYAGNVTVIANLSLSGNQRTGHGIDQLLSIEGLIGGNVNDLLIGNAVANSIDGGTGNDRVDGAAGNDTLIGGYGNDTILGGAGQDTLAFAGGGGRTVNLNLTTAQSTGEGSDRIVGVEHINGTSQNDSFTGSAGGNRLNGASGNDLLNGAGGNDTLLGGLGNDTINGGAGIDLLILGNDRGTAVDLAKTTAQATGEGVDIIFGIENVEGADGNDRLFGNASANLFDGDDGNDLLDGRGGNDRLLGDDGRDTLRGGTGDDFLTGGDDEDVFFFENGGGRDRIVDFEDGEDRIEFRSGANAMADLTYAQVGNDVHITYGGTNKVIVAQTWYFYLDSSDFIFS